MKKSIAPDCPKCKSSNTTVVGNDQRASGTFRKVKCKDCKKITNVKVYDLTKETLGTMEDKAVHVFTAAVNATKAHKASLAALEHYCKHNDAQLHVITMRYKNLSHAKGEDDAWYDPLLVPYLYNRREEVFPGLTVVGDIKILPTAARPLSGLDSLTGSNCGIFAHTKVSMESIATKGHDLPKLLYTTGAITVPDFSDSTAGKKGEFHHSLGAVVVERDGDLFHMRNISMQGNGSFYDLDKYYTAQGVEKAKPILALVAGDLHAERHDPANLEATFMAKDSIAARLKPSRIVLHDALDFGSAGHHNNFFEQFKRHHQGRGCVKSELDITYALMDRIAAKCKEVIVVDSNHNNHFMQWLESDKHANDLQNAEIFAQTRAGILPEIRTKGFCDPFEWWARKQLKSYRKTKFLGPNDSYAVHKIELGFHGDRGTNGARGSAMGLSKIGAKTIIGHSHSPKIVDGCYQTGTSSLLDLGYNKGASSWLHSHVIIYPNGKRTHIHVINGRYCATQEMQKAA
jgi:hypothetical protein